jgi:hypothetical protein
MQSEASAATLPCLFCFSPTSQPQQKQAKVYQGDRAKVEGCYKYLCDLLGLSVTSSGPGQDYLSLFGKDHLPLCIGCSLLFRNLADLHEQLLALQKNVQTRTNDIRNKIQESEQDGSLALAFAIQTIESSSTNATASKLAWIQNFRQRVTHSASGGIVSSEHCISK